MVKEQYRLYFPADGIWSQVCGSGRSNHSIVISESDGDVVVLEDRSKCTWTPILSTATAVQQFAAFLTNIPEAT